jgi:hypothetical protein
MTCLKLNGRDRLLIGLALPMTLLISCAVYAAGPTGLLNDTGQTLCNSGTAMVVCNEASTGDSTPAYPRQDGRFGRDPAGPAKVGNGAAGFDFTKVCMNGSLNCSAAADTTANPSTTSWACTKDNTTNLIWSLYSGLGDWTTYARSILPAAHNAQSRCGFSDSWRLPTRRELLSIVHLGVTTPPTIDVTYFPDMTLSNIYSTSDSSYWTSDPYQPGPSGSWFVDFYWATTSNTFIGDADHIHVRLVRSGL